ncbi:hypothetical protein SD77_0986 [Bacillus badius]|uniref:Uncharacterized protein n=1 Tax=Bacillus badius TaxID=1455 RepID=A0ABR5ATB8_BACBA|nr:hypothetical protein SD78_2499 [Bacillus badius]KIL78007.1 hypothetical protein SD77_0986 [Bacillus badius]
MTHDFWVGPFSSFKKQAVRLLVTNTPPTSMNREDKVQGGPL